MDNRYRPRSVCLFTCGSNPFAVDVDALVEVIEPGRVVRVPLAPRHLLGLYPYRGGIVPVVWTGVGEWPSIEEPGPRPAVLILRSTGGLWGLVVDRQGVVVVDARPGERHSGLTMEGFLNIVGEVGWAGKTHALFDTSSSWHTLRNATERWYGEVNGGPPPAEPSIFEPYTCQWNAGNEP